VENRGSSLDSMHLSSFAALVGRWQQTPSRERIDLNTWLRYATGYEGKGK